MATYKLQKSQVELLHLYGQEAQKTRNAYLSKQAQIALEVGVPEEDLDKVTFNGDSFNVEEEDS